MKVIRALVLLLAAVVALSATGCGEKKPDVKTPTATSSLDDAFALLPGSAIAVGSVDARAFFGSATFGADLAKLVEKYIPIGQEAGFVASRDVDRVTFASYSYQGIDVAAIVVGRFDEAKIKQLATSQTPTKAGVPLVASTYAGRQVYTVNNIGFTVLSPTHAVVGTESGIRRVLERIKDNRVNRDIPAWMIQTVETPGSAAAVAADFASQPIPEAATRQLPLPFLQGLKAARVVASFKNGTEIAASLTYPDAPTAEKSSEGVKQAAGFSKALALIGIKVQNIQVTVEKQDVQVKLAVDDQSLRQLLASAPQWLGQ